MTPSLFISAKDQKRTEKVSKRLNAIQEVKESVSLLGQLLEGYSKDSVSHSNQELIKVSLAATSPANHSRRDACIVTPAYHTCQVTVNNTEHVKIATKATKAILYVNTVMYSVLFPLK